MTVPDAQAARAITDVLHTTLVALSTRGTMLFALAFLVSKLARSLKAAQRHAMWLAVLLLLAVLPAAQVLPVVRVPLLDFFPAAPGPPPVVPQPGGLSVEMATGNAAPPFGRPWRDLAPEALYAILAAWAVGALVVAARPIVGRLAIARIATSRAVQRVPVAVLRTVLGDANLRGVRVLTHPQVAIPFACGIFRPAIFLPCAWSTWAPKRLEAILVHELAHVRRRDSRANAAAQAACALLWFDPMVWVARSFLFREAEFSCDEEVLSRGIRGTDYASTIVAILRTGGAFLRLSRSALGRSTGILKERVEWILANGLRRDGSTRPRNARSLLIAAGALSVLLLLSFSPRGVERLAGTWKMPTQTLSGCDFIQAWNENGTGATASVALPEVPMARCRFVIERKWRDSQGYTWYHILARWTGMPFLLYTVIRLNPSATAYELTDSPLGYPAGFRGEPGDGKHLVFIRL